MKIGITHGDTNGVGYEVILKAMEDPTIMELCTPVIYGSPKLASYHRKALEIETNFTTINNCNETEDGKMNVVECISEEVKVDLGQGTPESAQAAMKSLNAAIQDMKEGLIDVLVTNEVCKDQIKSLLPDFPGEQKYIQKQIESEADPLTILINEGLRVALLTEDLPLNLVAASISQEKVLNALRTIDLTLRRDFMLSNPRIAVLALNPESGKEEEEILAPAIQQASEENICAYGPLAADEFFGNDNYVHFDCVLAMYNDQGHAPFRALSAEGGVRYTAGLPIVHTRPEHGCEFRIAGKGEMSPHQLLQAIFIAQDALRNRKNYDEARKDPLQKLYHDKREDKKANNIE